VNPSHPCQGLEQFGFELTSVVGGYGLRASKADYPARQYSASHGAILISGMGITSGQRVKRSTALWQYV
jgi:hypothetical protein